MKWCGNCGSEEKKRDFELKHTLDGWPNERLLDGRVETEAPPAGDLRRRSGRSPGRGSPVGNLKPPAITETPVLAGAPDKTGDF